MTIMQKDNVDHNKSIGQTTEKEID